MQPNSPLTSPSESSGRKVWIFIPPRLATSMICLLRNAGPTDGDIRPIHDCCEIGEEFVRMHPGQSATHLAKRRRHKFDAAVLDLRVSGTLCETAGDDAIGQHADGVIAGGLAERAGYTKVEHSCIKLVASPLGEMRCGLAWMHSDELLADLAAIMDRADVPV